MTDIYREAQLNEVQSNHKKHNTKSKPVNALGLTVSLSLARTEPKSCLLKAVFVCSAIPCSSSGLIQTPNL